VRTLTVGISLALALLVLAARVSGAPADQQPEPTSTPESPLTSEPTTAPEPTSGTPVVDPEPLVLPLYLPRVEAAYDETVPPPVVPTARGYLAEMQRAGREACPPARHILLTKPEGTPGNKAVAVLVQDLPDPELTLDLYVAEYVEVKGIEELAPEACRQVTSRLIRVRELRVIDLPPGR
jgi:hypothetical protein